MNSNDNLSEDELKSAAKIPAALNLMMWPLSPPPLDFIQSCPFLRQPSAPNPNFQLLISTSSNVVCEVQKSLISNAEKCIRMLENIRSQNAAFDRILSFAAHLQSCCQIPHRSHQNLYLRANQNFAAILPGDSVAGVVVANGILNFLNIYNTLLIVRLVLTWFPNAPPAVVSPLRTLCDPYLNIFRGIIPPLGGTLDLSPILAFLVLNAFTSTASALPAELPPSEASSDDSLLASSHLTRSQKKWKRRLAGYKSKRPNGEA